MASASGGGESGGNDASPNLAEAIAALAKAISPQPAAPEPSGLLKFVKGLAETLLPSLLMFALGYIFIQGVELDLKREEFTASAADKLKSYIETLTTAQSDTSPEKLQAVALALGGFGGVAAYPLIGVIDTSGAQRISAGKSGLVQAGRIAPEATCAVLASVIDDTTTSHKWQTRKAVTEVAGLVGCTKAKGPLQRLRPKIAEMSRLNTEQRKNFESEVDAALARHRSGIAQEVGMTVSPRYLIRWMCVAVLAAIAVAAGQSKQGWGLIEGCPDDAGRAGDKIVIGSVTELVGEVNSRLARALLAAFEMRFEKAKAELDEEASIVYCEGRPVRESNSYNEGIVSVLNDEQILLEVGAHPDGQDIMVTYVVIPIRHYAFFGQPQSQVKGYHQAIYEQSRISSGLEQLFRNNAELRLMAALALALRHEKLADGESEPDRHRTLLHRSRAFYCDALGSLDAAKPRPGFLGLPESEWEALGDFARAGAQRLFGKATGDPDYVGILSVVESELGAEEGDDSVCARPLPPIVASQ